MSQNIQILITTDFHASPQALRGLEKLLNAKKYTAIIMAGDLINPRPKEVPYIQDFIDTVKRSQTPLFGLHGNNEPNEAFPVYRQSGMNIHLETKQLGDYNICGIGGFGYLNEPGFEDLSVENLIINQQTIFVTHVPPRVTDTPPNGPFVHIFGHRHSLAYAKMLGQTLHIQCPAGTLGKATELILPERKANFIDLF